MPPAGRNLLAAVTAWRSWRQQTLTRLTSTGFRETGNLTCWPSWSLWPESSRAMQPLMYAAQPPKVNTARDRSKVPYLQNCGAVTVRSQLSLRGGLKPQVMPQA